MTAPVLTAPVLTALGVALPGRLQPTDVDLFVGGLVALIGPNGSGKTSLLHALAGVGTAAGVVRVSGRPLRAIPSRARPGVLGFVPASRELAWPLAVRDLVTLTAPRAPAAEVEAMLEMLDLAALATRPVNLLSTGERSRVLLARALLPRPSVLLLDEPFANLDPLWRIRLAGTLRDQAAGGTTILFSAHDLDLAEQLADRVLVMAGGRIVTDGGFPHIDGAVRSAFGVTRGASGAWVEAA